MGSELKGKTALITAASCISRQPYEHSLGYGIACALAQQGADLAIVSRTKNNVERAAQYIYEDYQVNVVPITADLTELDDLDRIAEETKSQLGDIDILVLSTPHPPTVSKSDATSKQWEDGFLNCLLPSLILPRNFKDQMIEKNSGTIVYIGSPYGIWQDESTAVQSAVKRTVCALASRVSNQFSQYGITSNVICPGYYKTGLIKKLAEDQAKKDSTTTEAVLESWKAYSPNNVIGDPKELGGCVARLAQSKITGKAIIMNWKTEGAKESITESEDLPGAKLIDLSEFV